MAQQKKDAEPDAKIALADAQAYEDAIAAEAARLWATQEQPHLTIPLYRQLRELLRRPIHIAHLQYVEAFGGAKPYESTGVSSVQVQLDRMDNVLGAHNWTLDDRYEQDGRLCRVEVTIFLEGKRPIERGSWGGVEQASTLGNSYKGSFTNAAKRALAMIGPGHEVYAGEADLDPDVNRQAAEAAALYGPKPSDNGEPHGERVTDEQVTELANLFADSGKTVEDWAMWRLGWQAKRAADLPAEAFEPARDYLTPDAE